jgi:hypothetical protein
VRPEDVSEAATHDHYVVLVEVGGSGLALTSKAQGVGISGEELASCDLTHREHQSINIITPIFNIHSSTTTRQDSHQLHQPNNRKEGGMIV